VHVANAGANLLGALFGAFCARLGLNGFRVGAIEDESGPSPWCAELRLDEAIYNHGGKENQHGRLGSPSIPQV
jgi:hypothetical protein